MSSYCTAFAYRPVVENISSDMADFYLEVPEEITIFKNLLTSRSVRHVLTTDVVIVELNGDVTVNVIDYHAF